MKTPVYTRFSTGLPPIGIVIDVRPVDPANPDIGLTHLRRHNENGTVTLYRGKHDKDYDASAYEWVLYEDLHYYHAFVEPRESI